MYIDFHSHIDFYKDHELQKVYDDINENNIKVISCAMDEESYKKNFEFSKSCSNIIPTFGIHPWKITDKVPNLDIYDDYIKSSKIIGEVGLDFHWVEDKSTFELQIEVFKHFVKKAKTYDKFLNIHTKGAEKLVYDILNKENMLEKSIIHWYSGDFHTLNKFIDSNSYFTLSVDINTSQKSKEIAKLVPLDHILAETDGPTALEWVNGAYGMPSEIINVYNGMCSAKDIQLDELKYNITKTYNSILSK
ncbi:TatD family hydrolase [Terrisporobacter muris]|uniref:TatD family hydrolase n=1 Tax=Terrisporobacter muris TaxID=2963284 RepID=A0A9X2S239_9FIRM|nr:TatD family hydrolase [Terrisporobacter muris]MCR1821161.1 TatD family hydrolase [Terrisporobacter muris]